MSQRIRLSVVEIVGSRACFASDDGQKVHDRIAAALRKGLQIEVSFLDVTSLTPTFLNAAIGQLYGGFTEGTIRASAQVCDLSQDDMALLKRVVDTAKTYFKNIHCVDQAVPDSTNKNLTI